jgi:hypothetical protein
VCIYICFILHPCIFTHTHTHTHTRTSPSVGKKSRREAEDHEQMIYEFRENNDMKNEIMATVGKAKQTGVCVCV